MARKQTVPDSASVFIGGGSIGSIHWNGSAVFDYSGVLMISKSSRVTVPSRICRISTALLSRASFALGSTRLGRLSVIHSSHARFTLTYSHNLGGFALGFTRLGKFSVIEYLVGTPGSA